MELPLWIAVFYFVEFVRDDQRKWYWKWGDSHDVDGLEIVTEISYKELYGKLLDLCNGDYSLHELEMRFLLPGDAMFAEPIQIILDKHVHWYVGLNKQGYPRPICITRVSKGPALVNDKTDAVKPGELELEIETETLSFNNLRVWCILHASPEEREEEYVRLFVSDPRREDPILDAYLHDDIADGAAGDEEPDDIFEQVREDDPLRSPVAQDEHEVGQSSPAAVPRAPLRRSRPCCEHRNMLRQILEQIKKLTDQVDELKRKRGAKEADDREVDTGIDRTWQKSVEELVDTDVETTIEGEADAAVGTWIEPTVEVAQEEAVDTGVDTTVDDAQVDAVITGVDTPVEGEAKVAVDTRIGKTVEGDAEKADQPRRRTTRSVRQKYVQEKPKVFLCRSKRKVVEKPDVDEQLRKTRVKNFHIG
ncbi:hypothetical protein Fot_19534 [Forsythia ovata]|uniref:Uncharacterized protein n=1 Tax=Forsythia ovata TaxID=205694 RepID=A0ABD1VNC3_9LAMI